MIYRKKILVIWDNIDDVYHYCISRENPEWDFPVVIEKLLQKRNWWAWHLVNCLEDLCWVLIDVDHIFWKNWHSIKHRYCVDGKVIMRVDEEKVFTEADAYWINYDKYDYIVISDYKKWSITEELIKWLPKEKLIVDTKPEHFDWFKWAYIIKPNKKEFMATWLTQEEFVKKYNCNLFLTLWEDGAEVYTKDWQQFTMPALNKEPVWICWAWDAFLSWLVYWLCNGWIYEALLYWSLSAAVSCRKAETNCPSLEDIKNLKWELGL